MHEQATPPSQLALPIEEQVSPEHLRAMRRVFQRRWSKWHHCKRFEDAMADPISRRLLLLAVTRGSAPRAEQGR